MRMIIIALRSGEPLRRTWKHDIAHIASSITLASFCWLLGFCFSGLLVILSPGWCRMALALIRPTLWKMKPKCNGNPNKWTTTKTRHHLFDWRRWKVEEIKIQLLKAKIQCAQCDIHSDNIVNGDNFFDELIEPNKWKSIINLRAIINNYDIWSSNSLSMNQKRIKNHSTTTLKIIMKILSWWPMPNDKHDSTINTIL